MNIKSHGGKAFLFAISLAVIDRPHADVFHTYTGAFTARLKEEPPTWQRRALL